MTPSTRGSGPAAAGAGEPLRSLLARLVGSALLSALVMLWLPAAGAAAEPSVRPLDAAGGSATCGSVTLTWSGPAAGFSMDPRTAMIHAIDAWLRSANRRVERWSRDSGQRARTTQRRAYQSSGRCVCGSPGGRQPFRTELRLGQVGSRTALRWLFQVLGRLVRGQQEDYWLFAVAGRKNPSGRFQSVDTRQVHVHQHQVRSFSARGIDRSLPGLSLARDHKAWRELDHAACRVSKGRLIVGDQHPHVRVVCLHLGTT